MLLKIAVFVPCRIYIALIGTLNVFQYLSVIIYYKEIFQGSLEIQSDHLKNINQIVVFSFLKFPLAFCIKLTTLQSGVDRVIVCLFCAVNPGYIPSTSQGLDVCKVSTYLLYYLSNTPQYNAIFPSGSVSNIKLYFTF